jgi:hypothetical protein
MAYRWSLNMSTILVVTALGASNASTAQAHDWYEVNPSRTRCLDITSSVTPSENLQLETPEGTEALYKSLGETVSLKEVKDASGAPIIMMHINDSDGDLIFNSTFYPSMTDCKYVLAYNSAH